MSPKNCAKYCKKIRKKQGTHLVELSLGVEIDPSHDQAEGPFWVILRVRKPECAAPAPTEDQPLVNLQVLADGFEICSHLLDRDVEVFLHVLVVGTNRRRGVASAALVHLDHEEFRDVEKALVDVLAVVTSGPSR